VFAGEDACARGSTNGVGAEGVYKQRALRGEAVDVRSLEMLRVAAFAVGGDGLQRVVIGKDEQDVRLLGFSESDGCSCEKDSSEEDGKLAHREMDGSNDPFTRLETNRARAKAVVKLYLVSLPEMRMQVAEPASNHPVTIIFRHTSAVHDHFIVDDQQVVFEPLMVNGDIVLDIDQ
jgi:hypothetical protein